MQASKSSVRRRVNIAMGQLKAIQRMIDEDAYCLDISNQLLAAQALLKRANQEILEAHIRTCVSEAIENGEEAKVEEALSMLEKMAQA